MSSPGQKITLVRAPGSPPQEVPPLGAPQQPASAYRLDTSTVSVQVGGSIDSIRLEVDDAYADLRTCLNREPDEVMRLCSGHSARMSEIRTRILRVEDYAREWRPVREREIEPLLKEIEFQFNVASRRHTVREFDYRLETGDTR